jgi:hypothetical protein
LFKNGVQVASISGSTGSMSSQPLYIGTCTGYNGTYGFNGYISNVRIVNGTALYTANFTPPTSPLTAVSGTSFLGCQSNRFVDNSSYAASITVNSTPMIERFNPFGDNATPYTTTAYGGSAYFNGTTDYVSVPGNANYTFTGNFTLEMWVYPLITAASYSYISTAWTGSNASECEFVVATNSSNRLYLGYTCTTTTVALNQWNHIAIVRSGSTITMYVNGIADATTITLASAFNYCPGGILINYYGGAYVNNYLSDYRIVNGTAVYTTNFTPPTGPLTAITNTQLLLNCQNGNIIDSAMVNNMEAAGSTAISTAKAKFGTSSIHFNGTNSYLWVANDATNPSFNFGAGNFTIEAWIYPTAVTGIICAKRTSDSSYAPFLIQFGTAGAIDAYFSTNGSTWATSLATSSGVTANTWSHIAIVRNGATVTIYINGTGFASNTALGTSALYANNAYGVVIGADGITAQTGYFSGYMQEFRITSGVARYTTNFTVPTAAFPNQ